MTHSTRARLLLLLTTLVWGGSFVIVKHALISCSPLLFNLLRMALAAAVLFVANRREVLRSTRADLRGGALAGVFLALGYGCQTLGLVTTSAAHSAFLTGLVVVFVPLLTALPPFRKALAHTPWPLAGAGATLAFAGIVLLTAPAGASPGLLWNGMRGGDLLTLLCAVCYALHLLTLARISPHMPPGRLATLQIASAALLTLLLLPWEPRVFLRASSSLGLALLFTATFSTAMAFTVQSYAQQHLRATETSLLLTLEPVFASIAAYLLLGERLGGRGLAGAALILLSIAVVELAPGLRKPGEMPA